jgi:hypothetical protein
MIYTLREIENLAEEGRLRIVVDLDAEASALLGRADPLALMGTITFEFNEHMSEAAILSAIRNELTRRKLHAQSVGRLSHLKGKAFDL